MSVYHMRLCQYQEKEGFRKQAATTTVTTTTAAAAVTTTTIVRTTKKHSLQRESVALDWNGCGCYFRLCTSVNYCLRITCQARLILQRSLRVYLHTCIMYVYTKDLTYWSFDSKRWRNTCRSYIMLFSVASIICRFPFFLILLELARLGRERGKEGVVAHGAYEECQDGCLSGCCL